MLTCMWDSKTKGMLAGTHEQIARMIGCPENVYARCLQEIVSTSAGDVQESNGIVTIINRRMFREEKDKENNRLRQERKRERDRLSRSMSREPNGKVTPSSSSSSSSSSSLPKDKESKSHCESPQKRDPHVKEFIDFYFQAFQEKFLGQKPVIDGGKDGKIIKGLLKIVSLEELKDLLLKFFDSDDPFVLKSGYTVGAFKSQVNKLRTSHGRDGVDLWLRIKETQDGNKRPEAICITDVSAKGDIPDQPVGKG